MDIKKKKRFQYINPVPSIQKENCFLLWTVMYKEKAGPLRTLHSPPISASQTSLQPAC